MTERPSEKPPWPESEEELIAYIRQMIEWPDGAAEISEGYGRCVYSMAYAALATFYYVSSKLGVTGFQASCADMEFLRQSRHMEHGFRILNGENLLYPQYDLLGDTRKWIKETLPTLAETARENLKEDGDTAHPDVRRHWERLAAMTGKNGTTP